MTSLTLRKFGMLASMVVLLSAAGGIGYSLGRPGDSVSGAGSTNALAVERQSLTDPRTIAATLSLTPQSQITLNATGVVLSSSCSVGQMLSSGQVIATVNDIAIIGLHTEVPLYRDLVSSDRGEDVTALQAELTRLGYPTPSTGIFDTSTNTAVQALRAALGVATGGTGLRLAEVVWLPTDQWVPRECSTTVGANTGGSDAFALGMRTLESVVLAEATAAIPGARHIRMSDGTSVAVDTPTDDLVALLMNDSAIRDSVARGSDDGLDTVEMSLTIELIEPVDAVAVPASAVFGSTELCVRAENSGAIVPVEVLTYSNGVAYLLDSSLLPSIVDVTPSGAECSS